MTCPMRGVTLASTLVLLGGCQDQILVPVTQPTTPTTHLVTCAVSRLECLKVDGGSDNYCTSFPEDAPANYSHFNASICVTQGDYETDTDACYAKFCNDTLVVPPSSGTCTTNALPLDTTRILSTTKGICSPTNAGITTYGTTAVSYQRRYFFCSRDAGDGSCGSLVSFLDYPEPSRCLVTVDSPALGQLRASIADNGERAILSSVEITDFRLNDVACTRSEGESTQSIIDTSGTTAFLWASGVTVPLTATGGSIVLDEVCSGSSCTQQVKSLEVNFADVPNVGGIAGSSVSALKMRSVQPAWMTPPISGVSQVVAGALRLLVTGIYQGNSSQVVVTNTSAWEVDVGATGQVILGGAIDLTVPGIAGVPVTVSADVNLEATTATPEQAACANATQTQKVLGLEDRTQWASSNADLSFVSSPITQGCGALGIQGMNYMIIAGKAFSTVGLTTDSAMSVDLYIPSNQPNPYWIGALQMFLSCPSGGMYNHYVGQVELTGLAQAAFNTLRYPLDYSALFALSNNLTDCSFSFGLNVNQTGNMWILDNMRFTP